MMEAGPAPSTPTIVLASGRVSQPPVQLIKEIGKAALTAMERNCCFALSKLNEEKEYVFVGAGIGSGIHNTQELKVLSFGEAMAGDDDHEWEKSV